MARELDLRIIGDTLIMRALKDRVAAVALSDGPVLLTGETGTGKELVAQTIHALGARRDMPLVCVNCAAFPEALLEAELFGHERGAFTGALQRRDGRFVSADGGTLFLDEIAEMSPNAQAKLLRVLADGSLQRVGSDDTVKVDVRMISATNADLRTSIQTGAFREDLYYRLKLFHMRVPPLRERREDLMPLVEWFCWQFLDRPPPRFSARALAALTHHPFPGNIRELRNAVRHALALAGGGDIELEHLPDDLRTRTPLRGKRGPSLAEAMRAFEREFVLRTLHEAGWNKTRAAEMLQISRKTLWTKLREHGIEGGEGSGEHDETDARQIATDPDRVRRRSQA
ncbi:MAG TPA: sigma-54 dependent transcriptional regulator [Kofleriaceae bacterium]|nr:sigma-54 dependent transcriptional regulator [Kofleriaceae bacterium]